MYIPEGYGTVFPYMIVDRVEEFTEFLLAVFDASVEGRTTFPNGRVANIRVRIGTSCFMISEAGEDTMKAMPATYYIYVEDVDSTFEAALENGGKKIMDPADMSYGDRQAGIADPSGNLWWISRRLAEEPYDD